MSEYIIKGGNKVEGTIEISATILNAGKTTLYNVPHIHDTKIMFEILEKLGGKVVKKNNKIIIDTSKLNKNVIPEELMRQMRSSVILAGGLLGRHKKAVFSYPGDCDIWLIHRTSIR